MFAAIGLFAFWFAAWSKIPSAIIKLFGWNRLYLFDCEKCLGFWLYIWYGLYQQNDYFDTVILAGCSSMVAMFLNVLNKLR